MEQKQVKFIGFRAENSGIIKAVELTPDILSRKMVVVRGESGAGKSSLMKLIQTAVSGTEAIASKNVLEKGYLTEAQLLDGEVKLFVGAKVTEYQRGESKGEPKFEIFLYSKDDKGNAYTPIVDGVKCTAGEYVKMLTTDLTFNMASLFTSNQAEHRKLIEKLFKPELDKLGADAVVAKILEAKKHRDACRILCQSTGSYMERFESQGFTETQLAILKRPDLKAIEEKLFQKKLELDRIVNGSEDRKKLEEEKIRSARASELQTIKDAGVALREKIRLDDEAKKAQYDKLKEEYDYLIGVRSKMDSDFAVLLELTSILGKEAKEKVSAIINKDWKDQQSQMSPVEPVLSPSDPELAKQLQDKLDEYTKLNLTPLVEVNLEKQDTSAIEEDIAKIQTEKSAAEAMADLYDRYQQWKNWIEAKGLYEKELDVLRKMYAGIDTGVKGMNIVPVETESDRVEVWIKYDGSYDTEFFHNEDKESRFMFEYSSFQCSAIGVMLQSARLNLKPKALRLAIVDDVAFTSKGLAVLAKMCEDFNVQLITSKTDDYDKENIADGEIIIEGGEIFFNK
jgi:ABC-type dipeptide/oligopeptide/nickel transport system ATPase component